MQNGKRCTCLLYTSADYRGSTGYGSGTYNNIDYGGLENEDVYISRNYMVDNFDIVDGNRVDVYKRQVALCEEYRRLGGPLSFLG